MAKQDISIQKNHDDNFCVHPKRMTPRIWAVENLENLLHKHSRTNRIDLDKKKKRMYGCDTNLRSNRLMLAKLSSLLLSALFSLGSLTTALYILRPSILFLKH